MSAEEGYPSTKAFALAGNLPQQLGRYQIVQKLGEGGMAAVYLAHDTKLDRRVAIKILPAHSVNDPDAVARFQREARALAKLSHPGIVQAHDTDQAGGLHFLVMEYVEGTNLASLVRDKGALPPTVAADYIHQAALALQHAHEKGLVHRDLKPSNLLLTRERQVKILDLGLARFLQDQISDPSRTREGMGMGTPDYAAPEQFRDAHSVDARADIYALGCTLYQLVTGQVPFPGSSLVEKYEAHERKEPVPLEERSPEAPGGLALVVRRMMAKHPADRFQTAREVAEALAPYVAGSSEAFQHLQSTSTWQGSQLTVRDFKVRSRGRRWASAGTIAVLSLALVLLAWMQFFRKDRPATMPPVVANGDLPGGAQDRANAAKADKASAKAQPAAPVDPNVLTVSQDAKDGGDFRTIGAALDKVKPGMTIRVLDEATYPEALVITRASSHARITLEAPRRATIAPGKTRVGILIANVQGVTLRGFRVRAGPERAILILVYGKCAGTVLDQLETDSEQAGSYVGASLEAVMIADTDAPVVFQNSSLRRAGIALQISGMQDDLRSPRPCGGIVLRNNQMLDCQSGVHAYGAVGRIQVVGNRIWGAGVCGIELAHLLGPSRDILIANNTLFENSVGFVYRDKPKNFFKGERFQLRNNVILASSVADLLCRESDTLNAPAIDGVDAKQLHAIWRLDHNWREMKSPPPANEILGRAWIPPTADDVLKNQIPVLSRQPGDPHFLRPAKDSPLASEGAGKTDPSLPAYVGAVPPEGVDTWDWKRTWQAWPPGTLLTVSKESRDGGMYRTIKEALAAAKPWTTIRVLDAASYPERIVLDSPARHEGIVLEAPKQATLVLGPQSPAALAIKGVPNVCVRGFRFRESKANSASAFLTVAGHSPGVMLDRLDIQAEALVFGIILMNVRNEAGEAPLSTRQCTVRVQADGIVVGGPASAAAGVNPSAGVVVQHNRVQGALRGIFLQGAVTHVQVSGNLVWDCMQAALQVQDLGSNSGSILFCNNTAFDSSCAFRIWHEQEEVNFNQRRMELCNNLFLDAVRGDFVCFTSKDGGNFITPPDRSRPLLGLWQFHNNWRDLSGSDSSNVIPLAADDQRLDAGSFLSRDAAHADFMRPVPDSRLAKEATGSSPIWLPAYAGAVPPKGVEPWDWEKTWNARMRTTRQ